MAEPVTAADDGEVNRDHEQHRHQGHLHSNRRATTSFPMTPDTASSTRTTSSMRHQSKWPASPASIRFRLCTGAASVWLTSSELHTQDGPRCGPYVKTTKKAPFFAARCGTAYTRASPPPTPTEGHGPLGGSTEAARTRGSWPNAPPTAQTAQNGRKWRFG